MKPRLVAAPLTLEDLQIRMHVDIGFNGRHGPVREWTSFSWILSDRRDADLMLSAAMVRAALQIQCQGGDVVWVRGLRLGHWSDVL